MAEYEIILCDSPDRHAPFAPLKKLGPLTAIKNRSLALVRNRAGSFNFNIRVTDPMAYKIMDLVDLGDVRGTVRKCVRVRRNNVDLWSGPIWSINGSLPDGWLQIGCVGWLEELQKRILWTTQDYSNGGLGTNPSVITFGLINTVNAQDTNHPLLIRPGSVTGSVDAFARNRYYPWGQTVLGPALQELSDIEAGFDYVVDPVTRELNLYGWDSYTTHNDLSFGYHWGPNNIKSLGWQEAADRTCNYMGVVSLGAPVYAADTVSQDQYGLFEEYNSITGANQGILLPYAEAELAVRSRPLVTYTITPFPNQGPRLFDDYDIGDALSFTAAQGAFKVKNQKIRVFGAQVGIDDVGNETISSLQLTPQG